MSKRIGLFGGTFDPVHKGHKSIAQSFLNSTNLDELWILLTPFPPHKQGNNQASYLHRKKMLDLAFSGSKNLKILTIENDLPKPSYSFNTIQHLKYNYPEFKFLYCIGGDNLASFNTWKNHEKILNEVELLVANRPGTNYSEVEDYIIEKSIFVNHKPISVSSSQIKEHIDQRDVLKKLLPEKVLDFIISEAIYRKTV
ncbi:MAG: nicotinate-nucleotide adenylyltransferase [Balneolaceae bacterium]